MKILKNLNHDQWLEERAKGIGASAIGAVMGVDKNRSPYIFYRQKIGLDPGPEENEAMWVGHQIEYMTAKRFEVITGASIKKGTQDDWIAFDEDYPFMRVSPDRIYWAKGERHCKRNYRLLELKSTCNDVMPDDGSIPQKWILQLQYQMGVMHIKHGALAWWTSAKFGQMITFYYKEFDFDPELYDRIQAACIDMWMNHIVPRIPPEAMTVSDVKLMYPNAVTLTVEGTENAKEIIGQLKEAKKRLSETTAAADEAKKEAQADVDSLEMKVMSILGTADNLVDPTGNRLASWKPVKGRVSFDKEAFAKEHPELYKAFCKEGTPYRVLRLS